jgi:hypothetical protein
MMLRVRRLFADHPRLVLAVLLAFAVEVMPPPSVGVSHRHAGGGDAAHAHGGRIVDALGARADATAPAQGSGLVSARARDLHRHSVQPLVALRGPVAPAIGPPVLVSAVTSTPACAEIPAAQRAAQARAPPSQHA